MAISIVSYLPKNRITLFVLQTCANLCLTLSYVFLNEIFGIIGTGIATARTAIFSIYIFKRKEVPFPVVGIIILVSLIGVIISFKTWFDVLYFIGLTIFTLSLTIKDVKKMKIGLLCSMVFYFVYQIFVHNYTGALSTVLEFVSAIVGLIIISNAKVENKK